MNGVGLQEPAIEKKPAGVHGFNLSALAVRERSVTLFFLNAAQERQEMPEGRQERQETLQSEERKEVPRRR